MEFELKREFSLDYVRSTFILPCLRINCNISENQFLNFVADYQKGIALPSELLVRHFSDALRREKEYALSNNLIPNTLHSAVGYWMIGHNQLIETRSANFAVMSRSERERCKTSLECITSVGPAFYELTPDSQILRASKSIYPSAVVGERVLVHKGDALADIFKYFTP